MKILDCAWLVIFLNNPQVSLSRIEITEHLYNRLSFDGRSHPHAYSGNGLEKHITVIVQNAESIKVISGIKDLLILKTTDSGFTNYIKDKFTSLKETNDRILATQCEVTWVYNSPELDFTALFEKIRIDLLQTFSDHKSLSLQQTMFAMGETVLINYSEVKEISFKMRNKHHILFNLEQFGMNNENEIFIATDEPYGYITGTVEREE